MKNKHEKKESKKVEKKEHKGKKGYKQLLYIAHNKLWAKLWKILKNQQVDHQNGQIKKN